MLTAAHLGPGAGDAETARRAVAEAVAADADISAVVHARILPPEGARPRLRAVQPLSQYMEYYDMRQHSLACTEGAYPPIAGVIRNLFCKSINKLPRVPLL